MQLHPRAENAADLDTKAVPLRHPGQWASAALLLFILSAVLFGLAQNKAFHFAAIPKYFLSHAILQGLIVTVELTLVAEALGILIGVVVASIRTSTNPVLRIIGSVYVWFFRGTPVLVQLVFWFNLAVLFRDVTIAIPGGPVLYSVPTNTLISGFTAALLGLGLNEGAYMSEIVRTGLLAVDHGQTEAAQALGFTRLQTLRRVVLPQALRIIVPPTGNQLISMLKTTSLVSVIAGGDLLTQAQNLYSSNFYVLELLVVASIWYVLLTSIASVGQFYLERHLAAGVGKKTRPASLVNVWRKSITPGR
jgi:polar amino acid transport system permease protein